MAKAKAPKKEKQAKDFVIKYIIPDNLQDLYVNGAHSTVTPRTEIFLQFYSERQAIPKKTIYEFDESDEGILKSESIEKGGDVVRLMQTSLVLDVNTAREVRDLLDRMISRAGKIKESDDSKEN